MLPNNQIIKIWCGCLKSDAGRDGKQGIDCMHVSCNCLGQTQSPGQNQLVLSAQ